MFRAEANRLGKLDVETWVIPRFTSQYKPMEGVYAISCLIDKAASDAEASDVVRVLTLGLLNQIDGYGDPPSTYHRYRFSVVPIYECTLEDLQDAYSGSIPYIKDGLLFRFVFYSIFSLFIYG